MSFRLTDLPRELQIQIFSSLTHNELTKVVRTSKSFQKIVAPLIWTDVELHDCHWHECDRFSNYLTRNYIKSSPELLAHYGGSTRDRYFRDTFFHYRDRDFIAALPITRPEVLRMLKSVCMTITFINERDSPLPDTTWTLFSRLSNLQALELTVQWPYDPQEWVAWDRKFRRSGSLPSLDKLQELRLSGYVPQAFARWLLINSKHLHTLQLYILDRPISGTIANERTNLPPGQRDRTPTEDAEEKDDDEIEDSDSDHGTDYEEECIAPRALSILEPTDTLENLKEISTLILTRPAQSGDPEPVKDIYYSIRCDRSILKEWKSLIRATRSTLKNLVLDQRPFAEDIEMDGTCSDEYMEMYPYGSGHERFKKIVLPALLKDTEWPMLEIISFYGFDVPESSKTEPHPRVPRYGSSAYLEETMTFLPRVKERFEPLGVRVESHLGRRILFNEEDGVVTTEDGLRPGWRPEHEDMCNT